MSVATTRVHFVDLDRPALAAWCADHGAEAYRADQIRRWVFGKRVDEFGDMHDLPAALRARLREHFTLFDGQVVQHLLASDRTEKLLIKLADGEQIECVLMREPSEAGLRAPKGGFRPSSTIRASAACPDTKRAIPPAPEVETFPTLLSREAGRLKRDRAEYQRRTVCISTQVGCAMGCVFCASGLYGVKRNLTTGEILEQVLRLDRLLDADERITNVVVMGIGEPLANLNGLLPALATLNDKGGLGLGARRITISTVGLPEGIRQLAAHGKPYHLAVSLHAPDDELRTRIVPVNARIGISAILAAADEYFAKTGRRVTYEYVLLSGLNDALEHAHGLGQLLRGRAAHVNLIPMNPVEPLEFAAPSRARLASFVHVLERAGINVTIRKRKGANIDAACGQLRLQHEKSFAKHDAEYG